MTGALSAGAQNVVVNSDFSQGADGWEVLFDGQSTEVDIIADDDCPTNGSPGGCVYVSANTTGYTNTLIYQPVTLIAGTPYRVDLQFRMLSEQLEQYWGNLYLHDEAPQEGVDWTPPILYALSWWVDPNCGLTQDGPLSELACEGDPDSVVTPAGSPGEEVTYYLGFKFGTLVSDQSLAISLDDFVVESTTTDTEPVAELPKSFSISGVYPNPFNPSTMAVLDVREAGPYSLRVFDVLGRVVAQEEMVLSTPGHVEVPIDLRGQASGTYIIWIQHQGSGQVASAKASLVE